VRIPLLKVNNKGNTLSTFKIGATYIGTVVGAGFASGQEVLQFFAYYGGDGFAGLIITTLLFIIYGYIILTLGLQYNAHSHVKVIYHASGKLLGIFIDIVITFFLFGTLTAMIAGSGAIFAEQFSLPAIWGNILMTVTAILTTLFGISGVINAISFVVPLLLTGVLSITIMTIITNFPFTQVTLQHILPGQPPVPHWALSAIVYTSYNLVIAVAVLAPLGAEVKDNSKLKKGAIFGGLGLGIGASAILLSLILNFPGATTYEIPMIFIAGRFSPTIQIIYSIILLAEIYTTAVGNLFGFTIRVTKSRGYLYKIIIITGAIIAFITSRIGFSRIVHYLYPLVGYAGFIMLIGLTYGILKNKS